MNSERATSLPELGSALRQNVGSVVAADRAVLEPLFCAVLAGGHVLIDGVPGTGKSLLARVMARCLGGTFKRIQFTSDTMPADVTGSVVWRARSENFAFVPGPLFANVVLADEINRTSPRTLSSLLEAMEERRVTIDGRTRELPDPFWVFATRNGIEFHGTNPIPEAALDRFLVRIELGYPAAEQELELYAGGEREALLEGLSQLADADALRSARTEIAAIDIAQPVLEHCQQVVQATRTDDRLALGISPRAALGWLRTARARAALAGRDYVLPDDLKALAQPVLAHRLVTRSGVDATAYVAELVDEIAVPL